MLVLKNQKSVLKKLVLKYKKSLKSLLKKF